MAKVTLANLDKKVDLLLQEIGFIKDGQKEHKESLLLHTKQDEDRFDRLLHAQQAAQNDVLILKESRSASRLSFSRGWGIFSNFLSAVIGAGVGRMFGG